MTVRLRFSVTRNTVVPLLAIWRGLAPLHLYNRALPWGRWAYSLSGRLCCVQTNKNNLKKMLQRYVSRGYFCWYQRINKPFQVQSFSYTILLVTSVLIWVFFSSNHIFKAGREGGKEEEGEREVGQERDTEEKRERQRGRGRGGGTFL